METMLLVKSCRKIPAAALLQSAQECQSIGMQMAHTMLEEGAEAGREMF